MNFNTIKNNFFEYLKQSASSNVDLSSGDFASLFSYCNEFEQYLSSNNSDISIFSMSLKDIKKLGISGGQFIYDSNGNSDEFIPSEENTDEFDSNIFKDTMNNFLADKSIISLFDKNGDTKLSSKEIKSMMSLLSSLDGNSKNVSLNDFSLLNKLINSGDVQSLQDLKPEKDKKSGSTSSSSSTSNSSGGKPLSSQNTHQSNYSAPSGELNSYSQAEDLEEINKQIADKNQEINEQNELKADIKADDAKYTKMIDDLNKVTSDISTCTSNISTYENELHTIQYDITAAQAELDNLQDAVIFDEYQSEIDEQRENLKTKIDNLKAQETQKQTQLDNEKAKQDSLNTSKETLEQQIQAYENEHPDNEINEINNNIRTLKSDISALEIKKAEKERELKEQREKENSTDENNKENCDAYIYGKAQAYRQSDLVKFMMDYATDPETKKYYDKWYYEKFNGNAYCAIFTSNVVEILYAKAAEKMGLSSESLKTIMADSGDKNNRIQGVTGLEMSMESDEWGNKIQSALDNAGINVQATVDITKMSKQERIDAVRAGKIYPGMIFTYKGGDGSYHTGFIENINKDLSWNTIEGNTSVTYDDGSHENHTIGAHRRDATLEKLTAVANPTVKVLYWMSQLNYSESEIDSLIY